ncbi:site-specific integrase [Corynebacterium sp. HS2168-gen11]|uniref:tyrosine-type recombinase/integrase n=1 Tax=Corynebacterium sp. HS2168-gen11 TaxID=2974027 RepID=UPI00216AC4DA|nr:site-specific integrase [Corynebacterium sp. HS2168-gen11]MCS4535418.1 site-specific integrase [Corynebacterium sp. HS2168-gen11]
MATGRTATPLGTWGKIHTAQTNNGKIQASTYLRLHNGNTTRVRATATSKTAAINKLKQNCQQRLNITTNTPHTLTHTSKLNELLTHWLQQRNIAPSTHKNYTSRINNHIAPNIGNVRLNELTPLLLDSFIHTLPPATAKQTRAILSNALSLATRYQLIPNNPARETTPIKLTKNKQTRALTPQEFQAFKALATHYQHTSPTGHIRAAALTNILDLLAATGARIGEILTLKWQDVQLTTNPPTITIKPTKDKGKSTRYIELPNFGVQALERQKTLSLPHIYPYVFTTSTGTHIAVEKVELWIRQARQTWTTWPGLPQQDGTIYKPDLSWVTPHSFRRTMGTLLANAKGEYIASQQLGHADTATTRRHYIETPRAGQKVASVVEDYYLGT